MRSAAMSLLLRRARALFAKWPQRECLPFLNGYLTGLLDECLFQFAYNLRVPLI